MPHPRSQGDVTPIEPHAEEATEFFIICEHDPCIFDKLLNNVLDFIGYDRMMHISNLGKAGTGCIKLLITFLITIL